MILLRKVIVLVLNEQQQKSHGNACYKEKPLKEKTSGIYKNWIWSLKIVIKHIHTKNNIIPLKLQYSHGLIMSNTRWPQIMTTSAYQKTTSDYYMTTLDTLHSVKDIFWRLDHLADYRKSISSFINKFTNFQCSQYQAPIVI